MWQRPKEQGISTGEAVHLDAVRDGGRAILQGRLAQVGVAAAVLLGQQRRVDLHTKGPATRS